MRFSHGDLSFEVANGWSDESTLAFAEPPDASLVKNAAAQAAKAGIKIPAAAAKARPRTNFVLSRRPYTLKVPAAEFCANELKAMFAQMPNVKVGTHGTCKMGPVDAATVDVEVPMEGAPWKQLHALAILNGQVVHFVGTATPSEFERAKPTFFAALESVRTGA